MTRYRMWIAARAGARSAVWLALLASPAAGRVARAETDPVEQVLLVAPPSGLAPAVRTALSAWPIRVVVAGSASPDEADSGAASAPGASMPGSAERARVLAADYDAGAVVWLSDDGAGGRALWIYDAASGRTTTRRLTRPPPFDEPTAAAVALTVKTLLRHSSVVPVLERYGAEEARAETAARRTARLRADSSAALRFHRTGAGDVEPRLGLGFRAAPGRLGRLGAVAAGVQVGPGISVDAPDFTGRFSDLQIGAALLVRVPIRRRLEMWPRLGGSIHFTEVDGAISGQAERARAERINPAVDAGAAFELVLRPWLSVSAGAAGSYTLRRQIYLVGGEPVLTIPRLELEIAASLSVSLL